MDDFFAESMDASEAIDDEFEAARNAATERVADAKNDLFAIQLEMPPSNGARIRAARKKVRAAIVALQSLEEEWLNDHAFDLIAY